MTNDPTLRSDTTLQTCATMLMKVSRYYRRRQARGRAVTHCGLDTLARLSVYTVPSECTSYTTLLPHFLPPRASLPHTLVIIVLDWTRPWTFLDELHTWLEWVEKWAKGDGSRELEIVREENRERRKCARPFQYSWMRY